jgi:hypothetical protein
MLMGLMAGCSGAGDPAGTAWVDLFNGKNLSGWQAAPGSAWRVEDGVIALSSKGDGKEHNGEYLWTRETYGDFVLELEFRIPDQANSGIFLRTSDLKNPVYTGIEVQVANSFGRSELSRTGTAGAVYDLQAPNKNPLRKPGEWNAVRIECRGPRIQVALNDEPIVDLDLDRWVEPGKNPDGTKNKFPRALKDFARRGHIGLQDHGRPVWYRKLRLLPL